MSKSHLPNLRKAAYNISSTREAIGKLSEIVNDRLKKMKIPIDSDKLKLVLSEDLLIANSANHNRRGQNVLLCDGSVMYMKQRHTEISGDDIFTLMEMRPGSEITGCEIPSCETDNFLAP